MTIRAIAAGVHVLDVHVRHAESIPSGSEGALVDQIRMSPAGTAGGTAVVLAKLGVRVSSAGAIGADPLGRVLRELLADSGVDVGGLVERGDTQTSASVLPVRPNGDRPAWHCIGANGTFTVDDVDLEAVGASELLHLGGPEFLGGEAAAELLQHARSAGTVTSLDMLAPGDPDMLEWVGAALPHADHLLPNAEQLLGLTSASTLEDAARRLLERGVGCARRHRRGHAPGRRVRRRRVRHDRLRGRVQRRLPHRGAARPYAGRGRHPRQRDRGPGGPRAGHRPRVVRPGVGGGVRRLHPDPRLSADPQAQRPFSAASWTSSGFGFPEPGLPSEAFVAPLVSSLLSGSSLRSCSQSSSASGSRASRLGSGS